jgi:hypothetical protein
MQQKITLKDKKRLRTPINGKFNNIGGAYLLIKFLCINLQNIKVNKKYHCRPVI